jgi:glycerol-3-phosphate dehydrogenase
MRSAASSEIPPLYNRRCAAARLAGADGNHATQNHLFTCIAARVGHLSPRRSHPAWLGDSRQHRSLVCECEAVTAGEVQYAVENLAVKNLLDLRRRTRVGMGTCQGELCACRAAGLLARFNVTTSARPLPSCLNF